MQLSEPWLRAPDYNDCYWLLCQLLSIDEITLWCNYHRYCGVWFEMSNDFFRSEDDICIQHSTVCWHVFWKNCPAQGTRKTLLLNISSQAWSCGHTEVAAQGTGGVLQCDVVAAISSSPHLLTLLVMCDLLHSSTCRSHEIGDRIILQGAYKNMASLEL